jgi:hypothetical protein
MIPFRPKRRKSSVSPPLCKANKSRREYIIWITWSNKFVETFTAQLLCGWHRVSHKKGVNHKPPSERRHGGNKRWGEVVFETRRREIQVHWGESCMTHNSWPRNLVVLLARARFLEHPRTSITTKHTRARANVPDPRSSPLTCKQFAGRWGCHLPLLFPHKGTLPTFFFEEQISLTYYWERESECSSSS